VMRLSACLSRGGASLEHDLSLRALTFSGVNMEGRALV